MTVRISSLPLIALCPAASQDTEVRIGGSNTDADLGTAFHAAMADAMAREVKTPADYGVTDPEFVDLLEKGQAICGRLRARYSDVEVERSVNIYGNVKTLENSPGMMAELLARGTIDLVGYPTQEVIDAEGIVLEITDWKAGWGGKTYGDQIRGYALAIAQEKGLRSEDRISIQLAYVAFNTTRRLTVTVAELVEWWAAFVRNNLSGSAAKTFNPGGHCQFCARRAERPGKAAMVRESVEEFGAALVPSGELYLKVKLVEKMVKDAMEMVKQHVREHGPMILPDGRVLNFKPVKKTDIISAKAIPILVEEIGSDETQKLLEIGKGAMEDAIKETARACKVPVGKTVKRIMDRLIQEGAVIIGETERFEAQKPKETE